MRYLKMIGNIFGVYVIIITLGIGSTYDIFSELYHPGLQKENFLENTPVQSIPEIYKSYRRREKRTKFTGAYNGTSFTSYEKKVRSHPVSNDISWETLTRKSGRRTSIFVNVNTPKENHFFNPKKLHQIRKSIKSSRRIRRNVYGRDDRSYIPITRDFGLKEPYSYTVKISTGCSGVLISPRHVLSAAHCVHDQRDYIAGAKHLKVGFFENETNILWIDVKYIKISKGWINGGEEQGPFYDYALLKLAKKHNRPFMTLSISEKDFHGIGERISFSGFDDDKPEDTLWYRSCNVVEEDKTFLYHFCDAKPGSSGSGVYSWVYDEVEGEWRQELVGVFSGNRWRIYDEFFILARNFNVAVRLTTTKYAQICKWMGKISKDICKYQYKNKRK